MKTNLTKQINYLKELMSYYEYEKMSISRFHTWKFDAINIDFKPTDRNCRLVIRLSLHDTGRNEKPYIFISYERYRIMEEDYSDKKYCGFSGAWSLGSVEIEKDLIVRKKDIEKVFNKIINSGYNIINKKETVDLFNWEEGI